MVSFKNLFKSRQGGDEAIISELERQAADLALELNDAELLANAAYLDAANNDAEKPKADAAAADVKAVREKLARVTGALEEAAQRQDENTLIAEEVAAEARWKKAEKLARARADVGVEIHTLILKLSDYWLELRQLGEALYEAAPVRGSKLHNSLMAPANIEKALRLSLFKGGFKWAAAHPWDPSKIKSFSDVVKEGSDIIMAHRPAKITEDA